MMRMMEMLGSAATGLTSDDHDGSSHGVVSGDDDDGEFAPKQAEAAV